MMHKEKKIYGVLFMFKLELWYMHVGGNPSKDFPLTCSGPSIVYHDNLTITTYMCIDPDPHFSAKI